MLNHEVDSIVVKNINALFVQSEIVSHRFVDGYLERSHLQETDQSDIL